MSYDVIVCGQGIAGTALAWSLLDRDLRVLVIDQETLFTASRIAAGLITPVSGRRFTIAPGFDQLLQTAHKHYSVVSKATGHECLKDQPALRFCLTAEEWEMFAGRRDRLGHYVTEIHPAPAAGLSARLRGFAMPHARRLVVSTYLDRSREYFRTQNMFVHSSVAYDSIDAHADGVTVTLGESPAEYRARYLVFCGGFADAENPWLPAGVFNAAKGEILTVRIPGFTEARTIHAADGWLAPTRSAEVYRFGATYDHDDLDTVTTGEAHELLTARLRLFLDLPFTVLDQQAAIRPIGIRRMPIIGRHQSHPQIGWFNGLGSKGALWAPALAESLVAHLLDDAPLDLELVRPPGNDTAPDHAR